MMMPGFLCTSKKLVDDESVAGKWHRVCAQWLWLYRLAKSGPALFIGRLIFLPDKLRDLANGLGSPELAEI